MVLLSFLEFSRVLPSFTEFYRVLPSISPSHPSLLGFDSGLLGFMLALPGVN